MSEIPVQVRGVDIFKLPLSTTEGFVLSRVDGSATVEDIAMMCGIDSLQVKSILQRLTHLGAISWTIPKAPQSRSIPPPRMDTPERAEPISNAARAVRPPTPRIQIEPQRAVRPPTPRIQVEPQRPVREPIKPISTPAPHTPSPHISSRPPASEGDSQRPTVLPAASDPSQLYDSADLLEDVEIELERRKRILQAFHRVPDQTYYECLGVRTDVEKSEIKRAYFELSKQFHPDSLFGRRLGTYKHKMEVVFKRLTEAYDVLSKKKRREEYDEYLAATAETRRAQDVIARANREAAAIEETIRASLQPNVSFDSSVNEPLLSAPRLTGVLPPRTDVAIPEPAHASLRPPPTPRTEVSEEERRRLAQQVLRRRLQSATGRASSLPPRPSSTPSSAPPSDPPDDRGKGAIRDLARSLRDAHVVTGQDRVAVSIKRAQDAEAARDLVGASNFYRLALAAAPHREDLKRDYERVAASVAAQLAASYEKQALYEERSGRWKEAGIAWTRVCEGRPDDVKALRSAASAILRGDGDLHTALKYAKHHVALAGENAGNLTLLARVYLGAGLKLNARRELEKAAKLDPSDEMIKNLLKEAR